MTYHARIAENGRLVLPADLAREFGLKPGDVERHAIDIAQLRPLTKYRGLSFGDRACLAPALATDLPVLTTDTK